MVAVPKIDPVVGDANTDCAVVAACAKTEGDDAKTLCDVVCANAVVGLAGVDVLNTDFASPLNTDGVVVVPNTGLAVVAVPDPNKDPAELNTLPAEELNMDPDCVVFDAWDATAVLNNEEADDAAAEANTEGFSVGSVLVVEDGVVGVELWLAAGVGGVPDPKRGCGFIAEMKKKCSQ